MLRKPPTLGKTQAPRKVSTLSKALAPARAAPSRLHARAIRRHTYFSMLCGLILCGVILSTASPLAPVCLAQSNRATAIEQDPQRPLAYLSGQPIRAHELMTPLLETAGQTVLADQVLDLQLVQALKRRGLTVTAADREREEVLLLDSLSDDADDAVRLLDQLRAARGLGPTRYESLLRRNAALRNLIADQAVAREETIDVLFRLQHGPTARIRLIVTATAAEAEALSRELANGAAFSTLAIDHSIDPSASTGGLLSTMSLADPTYPVVVRETAAALPIEGVSKVIALDNAFALIKLVDKNAGDGTPLEAVRTQLAQRALRDDERRLMDDLARTLLASAELVPLDPTLNDAWRAYRQRNGLDQDN